MDHISVTMAYAMCHEEPFGVLVYFKAYTFPVLTSDSHGGDYEDGWLLGYSAV
jgi:hypothetical protein